MKKARHTKTLDQFSANLDSKCVPITKGVRSGSEYPYYLTDWRARLRESLLLSGTAIGALIRKAEHAESKSDFLLSHYVSVGVEELDQNKLTPLLRLKYHDSIADAIADLGKPGGYRQSLRRIPKYLYAAAV